MTEEWRTVAIAPDYEVSNLGRVRSHKGGRLRILRPCVNSLGYHNQTLYEGGQPVFTYAHALVMAAFVGPRPEGMDTRHLDGNPANNRLTNLAYGTRAENMRDKRRHGRNVNLNKTHCPQGHPYDETNTYVWPRDGSRHCRTCVREAGRRHRDQVAS
jgi:hypothetical protein